MCVQEVWGDGSQPLVQRAHIHAHNIDERNCVESHRVSHVCEESSLLCFIQIIQVRHRDLRRLYTQMHSESYI